MDKKVHPRKPIKCKNCKVSFLQKVFVGEGKKEVECRFNVCPKCGKLLPITIDYIENYFEIIQLSEDLNKAKTLFLTSELVGAAREAVIKFESIVRKKSGLKELRGSDLMAKAFSFKFDENKKVISEEPKLRVNDLSNVPERNEQEGIKFISMGLMQGVRNIYMHHEGNERLFYCLQIITMVDFLLKHIMGWESVASRLK